MVLHVMERSTSHKIRGKPTKPCLKASGSNLSRVFLSRVEQRVYVYPDDRDFSDEPPEVTHQP